MRRDGGRCLATVELKRPAAARLGRREHLEALGGEHPHRGRVHLMEENPLYATLQEADTAALQPLGRRHLGDPGAQRLDRRLGRQLEQRAERGDAVDQPAAAASRQPREPERASGGQRRHERPQPARIRE